METQSLASFSINTSTTARYHITAYQQTTPTRPFIIPAPLRLPHPLLILLVFQITPKSKGERGNREGQGEAGGSQGILGEGPGVVDLQRCWGCDEQSYQGRR